MKKSLNEKKEINDDVNIIIKKVCSYYDKKYESLSVEEKKELFRHILINGYIKQQFDDNEFYKALTFEEQKKLEEIGYWNYITFLPKSFGYTKMSELVNIRFLIELIKSKNSFNEDHAKEMNLYRDLLELYRNIAEELKLSTALELSYYYTYLLWNGYFSIAKEHEYTLDNRSKNLSFLAASVLGGGGACLEYSALLNDFLKVCNKESVLMACYVPRKKDGVIFEHANTIQRNINENTKQSTEMSLFIANVSGIVKKIGNHAVTVINENGQQFVFDATNLSVLNIENKLMASVINGSGYFDLKKNSLYLFNPTDCTGELFNLLRNEMAHSSLEKDSTIADYENTLKIVEKNKTLLDEGYNNILPFIEQISSLVLSRKK